MNNDEEEFVEKPAPEFLRDLAKRLRHVPALYDIDGYDIDRLIEVAHEMEPPRGT